MPEELLTTNDVARNLRVSTHTVWRWVKEGKLPASKPGAHLKFSRQDVDALISKHSTKAAPSKG